MWAKPKSATQASGAKASVGEATKSTKWPHVLVFKDGKRLRGRRLGKSGNKIFFKSQDGTSKFYSMDYSG